MENIEFKDFVKENIKVLLLGIYSISFINFYIYYKSFNIPIFNYIGLNDLIFFSLEYVFTILLSAFIFEFALFFIYGLSFVVFEKIVIFIIKKKGKLYLNSTKKNRNRINKLFNKYFDEYLIEFKFILIMLSIFIIPFIEPSILLYTTYFVYVIFVLERAIKRKDPDTHKFSMFFYYAISAIIAISMIFSTFSNSYNKRFEKDNSIISFYENSTFVSTNPKISCNNYLGETSSYLFLYNIKNKEVKIYSKSKITDYKIKNSGIIDEKIIKIKESKIYKLIKNTYFRKNKRTHNNVQKQ